MRRITYDDLKKFFKKKISTCKLILEIFSKNNSNKYYNSL